MRILAVFAAGYTAGVLGSVLLLPREALLPLGTLCALAALLCFIALRGAAVRRRWYAVLCCAGAAAGLLWSLAYARLFLEPARALDNRTAVLSGTVLEWPRETDYGSSVLLRADLEGGGSAVTLLYIGAENMDLRPGDRISTVARCRLADRSAGGEEITYYTAKGIFLTATAYGDLALTRPGRVPLHCLPAFLSKALKEGIDAAFPPDTVPIVEAVVTGSREALSDSYTSSLQRTGLAHTVAVSGMHLSFLAGALSMLLRKNRRRAALVILPVILLFTLVAGSTPSVVRSAVMVALLQLAPLLGRERDDFTALGAAALLLLVQNPYAAAGVGLQLSFASVAGILLFSGDIQERLLARLRLKKADKLSPRRLYNAAVRFIVSVFSATLGALVFTTPLCAVYFDKVSLIAPLANLLTLWAVAAVFCGGLAAGALGALCLPAGRLAAWAAVPFARYLGAVVPALSKIPFAAIPSGTVYAMLWLLLVYLVLALALVLPGKKRIVIPTACCVSALCAALLFTNLTFRAGAMQVWVLDVGQGQSVLIRAGEGLVLVDCGGDAYENAGDIAADRIQALGRSTLDLLVISHYHADHANGIPELLDRIGVKEIALPDVEEDSVLRRRILEQAGTRGIPVRFVREDAVLELGADTALTLYPPLGEGSTNELGLTVLCSAGDFDVLLTGDMGASVEKLLVEYASLPDVELMVAGHHGSRYANSRLLLETVRPDTAVFSVGEDNEYGHPAQETIDRFVQIGADLYRTDRMGTVTVIAEADMNMR